MTVLSEAVHATVEIPGAVAAALVDLESGNCLIRAGSEKMFSLSLLGAVNAQMLRAELRQVQEQFPQDDIQDLMITLGKQYHLIRLVHVSDKLPCLFLYVVMTRDAANLAIARGKMAEIARQIAQGHGVLHQVEVARFAALLRNSPSKGIPGFEVKLKVVEDEEEREELPPFMREETILQLARSSETAYGLAMAA